LPEGANEPILVGRLLDPGHRATLSATLDWGMKAVTIRLNDVVRLAGLNEQD
jgi:pilus assembly protein CpaB